MAVLFDVRPLQEPFPGGVTRLTEHLLPALLQQRSNPHDKLITTGIQKPNHALLQTFGSQHQHIPIPNQLLANLCALNLTSIDRFVKKADHLFLFNIGFVGKPKIPYSIIIHDLSFLIEPRWFTTKSRLWHRIVRAKQLIQNADHLFAVSETTKNDLKKILNIPEKKITVTHLGATVATQPATLDTWLNETPFLLAMDSGNQRKNTQVIIDAFLLLRQKEKHHSLKLVLTGKTTHANHHPNIIQLKHPKNEVIAALMKHAQAFLYPSWYEGFGLPLHEAAAFNTPCLTSTTSCLPETAPKNTLFIPPTRPNLWATAIETLLTNPTRWQTTSTLPSWSEIAKTINKKITDIS